MKHYLLLITHLFCCIISAQEINPKNIYPSSDYSFLKNILGKNRIVLLGEQTHGDGATFDEKIKLIKYLHENLGYNTIAFESGLYDNYKASVLYRKSPDAHFYTQSVIDIWSGTKAFQNLMDYMSERAALGDTIKLSGFDSQEGPLFENFFMEDLNKLLSNRKLTVNPQVFESIERAFIARDLEIYAEHKTDSLKLYNDFDMLLMQFGKMKDKNLHEKVMHQVVLSKIADVSYEIQALQHQKIPVQNPRDRQMANNMIFLTEAYPNDKFICWGASYHFSCNINTVSLTDTTKEYIDKQIILEKEIIGHSESSSAEIEILKEAVTMADILKKHFKKQLFSIAFSSLEGEYLGLHEEPFPILTPTANSIENKLSYLASAYVDWSDITSPFYCSALGNIPLQAKWAEIFDGLIFIKNSYIPELRKYGDFHDSKPKQTDLNIFRGTIYDAETRDAVPYADIMLLGTKQSIMANGNGEFSISLPPNNNNPQLVVTSFGYITDTINANAGNKQIRLQPHFEQNILLNEIVITNQRQLSAEDIVKSARKKVADNYYQEPYNQKYFYRVQQQRNNKIIFNEEVVVNSYHARGLSGSNNPSNNFYAQIEHLRNTIGNPRKDKWSGVGNLWTILDRDLILSKANVLYRTSSYELQKEEPTTYDGRPVYRISFINTSPGTFSTGYGYPAPIQSKGMLYIDKESFAVLKYEHCVTRSPRTSKKRPDIRYENSHNIITTYRQIDGKYFLNYCKEVTQENIFTVKNNKLAAQNYYTNELMSLHLIVLNPISISRPVQKLKEGYSKPEDQSYWLTNSFPLDSGVQFTECQLNIN